MYKRQDFIDEVMDVIRNTPQHTYQILTKRSVNMRSYFTNREVPGNAWLGVSVEDKKHGKPRIKDLVAINANTRFISAEPLLEDLGVMPLKGISWVIVGGESGKGARPMKEAWAVKIKDQCLNKDVNFFFKQWGVWGEDGLQRSKSANGRRLQGRVWEMLPV